MEPFTQEYRIRSSFIVAATGPEPVAVIRVRNLQSIVQGPHDAWGRPKKPQPLLVTATVSLREPFAAAAATDAVAADTVHYGTLSKAILASLACFSPDAPPAARPPAARPPPPTLQSPPPPPLAGGPGAAAPALRDVLERVWCALTGLQVGGIPCKEALAEGEPFLDLARVRALSVALLLPKASLLGDGVCLSAMSVFGEPRVGEGGGPLAEVFGIALQLRNLRVPTLIGVNGNERLSKQFVVANVEIDKFDYAADVYPNLERLVVKAMEETSFETLEALAAHLANKIKLEFRPLPGQTYSGYFGWQIKISLEKPTAVPFADAPLVEIRAGADTPLHSPGVKPESN